MSRQLNREDILNSQSVHLYTENVIYVEIEDDEVYGFNKGGSEWYKKENFYDYFESSLMMSYFSSITKEEAADMVEEWISLAGVDTDNKNKVDNARLNQAIYFATERHAGQFRKGTTTPFIVHPMETMTILASMKADTDLLIAGILHDTVEDTNTTIDEIRILFGTEVAKLVGEHSEDKSKTWEERKEKEYNDTCSAPIRLKKLVLADKLANLRSIYRDYKDVGNELWDRFSAGAGKQAWYYGKMVDALYELQHYADTEYFYWEMLGLYKGVFVIYSLDESKGVLYQENIAGEKYRLKKGKPEWTPYEGTTPKKAVTVNRKYAERLEDNWNEPFWETLERDMSDCSYSLYSSTSRSLDVLLSGRQLTFSGSDYGKECEMINGKDEYEFHYSVDEENTYALLMTLRNKSGIRYKLETVLKNEFGYDDGSVRFEQFCKNNGITYKFFSF